MYLSSFWLLTGPTVPTPTTWTSFRLSTRWSASLMSSPSLVKLMTKQGLELKRPSSKERTRTRPFHDASWFCVAFFFTRSFTLNCSLRVLFLQRYSCQVSHDFTKISSTNVMKDFTNLSQISLYYCTYVVMSSW